MAHESAFGEDAFGRYAEGAARFTLQYIVGQTLLVIVWVTLNALGLSFDWDPYPLILLDLAFSLQAAYAAPLILLAATRQAQRDKATAERDEEHRDLVMRHTEEKETSIHRDSVEFRQLLESNTDLTRQDKELTERVEALPRDPRCGTTSLAMALQAALFRGINVGRNRRVSMADIRSVLEEHYDAVRTHGQSGNVVLSAPKAGTTLERELERLMTAELGLETRILVRSGAQLAKVVKRNPLARVAKNPSRYLVTFLADKPDASRVRALQEDLGAEQAVLHGREVYSWHPAGLQRSKLAALIADGLGTVGTARNWNTVTKLHALTSD